MFVYPGLRSVNLPHPGSFIFDPFRVGGWYGIIELQLLHPVASYPGALRHSGYRRNPQPPTWVTPQVIEGFCLSKIVSKSPVTMLLSRFLQKSKNPAKRVFGWSCNPRVSQATPVVTMLSPTSGLFELLA
ncbi:MAG: hypothetical protein ACQES1_06180 [Bacteroidota bacterium]